MMRARASLARSRAVVTWRSSGRPCRLAKLVLFHAEADGRLVHTADERLLAAANGSRLLTPNRTQVPTASPT